ncbi:MAG: hypothetical protein KDA32_11975 [Phycisphaerales bacterium]|nr:hypothetical protein [Phycisphaerales bacterium]
MAYARNSSKRYGARRTSASSTWNRSSSYGRTTSARSTNSYSPTQFSTARNEIQARMGSYKNLQSQFSGSSRVTAFSPTTANRWMKLVNNGVRVFKFSNKEFTQKFGARFAEFSPTAACRELRKKYGQGVKAVTRGNGSNWLIACSPNISARPFGGYKW